MSFQNHKSQETVEVPAMILPTNISNKIYHISNCKISNFQKTVQFMPVDGHISRATDILVERLPSQYNATYHYYSNHGVEPLIGIPRGEGFMHRTKFGGRCLGLV